MTREQFIDLYNLEYRIKKGKHTLTFPEYKTKQTKKSVWRDEVDEIGRPSRILVTPAVSAKVIDTNTNTKLYQAVWEYYLKSKCKRIESEGRYRTGVGYIPSANKGHSDLVGAYGGKTYYIEVKRPNEKHIDTQIDFCRWVNSGGGQYHTVRSFEDMHVLVLMILNGNPPKSEQL